MKKAALVLTPLAAAFIAACTNEPVTPAPAPVVVAPAPAPAIVTAPTAPPASMIAVVPSTTTGSTVIVPQAAGPLRVGTGTVDSITTVPPIASSGGTVPSDMRRVGVRMSDNTVQYLDGRVANLSLGDRVEITSDGHLRYPVR
jgi:hypothetical protein